jgi:hypothetical protein
MENEGSFTMILEHAKVSEMLQANNMVWDVAWKYICFALSWDNDDLPEQLDVGPLLSQERAKVSKHVYTFLMDYIRSVRGWLLTYGDLIKKVCSLFLSLFI